MVVIGLTGGIGSGKSYVLKLLQERWGFPVFEADKIAKDLMLPPNDIYKQIVYEFGDVVIHADDSSGNDNGDSSLRPLDSEKLRTIVMNDPDSLAKLNSIVHPGVKKYFKDIIASEIYNMIIIESAILLQDGYDEICDEIWYVRATEEVRCHRIMTNRGYSYEKAISFMDNQPKDEYYLEHCDRVINNNEDIESLSLLGEVDSVVKAFCQM